MDDLNQIYKTWNLIFSDDFRNYDIGPFSAGYSALEEFYYPPVTLDQGPWEEISNYHLWGRSHNPDHPNWTITSSDSGQILKQTLDNRLNRKNWKYYIKKVLFPSRLQKILALPALAAGVSAYSDYCFKIDVRPLSAIDFSGLLFSMQDGQRYCIFALKQNRVWLLKREHNIMRTVASKKFNYSIERSYELAVTVDHHRIMCFIDREPMINVLDASGWGGRMGLISNVPAEYRSANVYQAVNPKKTGSGSSPSNPLVPKPYRAGTTGMRLWKEIDLSNRHSGRIIRIGDLTGDGRPDLLLVKGESRAEGDNYNAVQAICAMDLEGNLLWETGRPHDSKNCLSSDLPIQVFDIDNDGQNEVICAKDFHIEIRDGATGRTKLSCPTPESVPPLDQFPHILGDSIYICDLEGGGHPQNILLKDRYSKLWAYNHRLEMQWEYQSGHEMGHFPFALDINDDGCDEILVGYSLLDRKGNLLWELPLSDHADAVSVFRNPVNKELMVVIAASDEGLIFADIQGKIKKHLRLGHMQTVTTAKLIQGRADYQIATNTYWGSPGIIYVLDLDGKIISSFQPSIYGSPICPVNWLDTDQELLLLSAAPDKTGGLYDGLGQQVVSFPDDGHPVLCYGAADLDGDGYDELLCWDHDRMWIYHRSGTGGKPSPFPRCRHPQSFNDSNYRSNISMNRII